jgi:hypothetical protein
METFFLTLSNGIFGSERRAILISGKAFKIYLQPNFAGRPAKKLKPFLLAF